MGQILKFPTKKIVPVVARSGRNHSISVEVLDERRPRRTRWTVQFEIQEVAGYGASLKGFTGAAVAQGYRHRFKVTSTAAVRQFVAETSGLVAAGRVAVWVDGVRVRPLIAGVA
ncbi:hypothetical protein [Paracoccus sanguinis]|uniref:Uncharacterized protein n=1 Tax=Paracoccus sanguinis TaxID=1545044 RepID=A0A1H3CEH6_9RHOB|nr:hypothetical protein [Paracoccus sanguinis]KGJ18050.1 hypothetical protein IX57_05790 [Paracoccus sanguinis]SDX52430.1 hypothetical protein SAMN05444276_10873 [Paracoccus sanguinis]